MARYRSSALRNSQASNLNTEIGANAQVQLRSGVNAATGGQGVLLAQLTGNAGGWGVATNGVLTSNAITDDTSADGTGTVGHYQLNTSAGVFLESGEVNNGDGVTIDNAALVAGQKVESNPWVFTEMGG